MRNGKLLRILAVWVNAWTIVLFAYVLAHADHGYLPPPPGPIRKTVSHWPINPQLGIPPDVYAYLHEAVSGGPIFSTRVITCRRRMSYCDGTANQMGIVAFYGTREDRDQAEAKGWLGTGYFDLIEVGEQVKLGKLFMFVYADGRPGWHRAAATAL